MQNANISRPASGLVRGQGLRQGPLLVGIEAVEAVDAEDQVEPVADRVNGESGGVSLGDFRAGMRLREHSVDQVDPKAASIGLG